MTKVRRAATAWEEQIASTMTVEALGDCVDDGDDIAWWLAWDGAAAVGFAGVRPSVHGDGNGAFMISAGVTPSHRGKGIQKQLIRARVRWARKRGIGWIWTYTHSGNNASMRSLIRCGFLPWRPPFLPGEWVYWKRDIL